MRELQISELNEVSGGIGPLILLIPAAGAVGKAAGYVAAGAAIIGAGVVAGVAIGEAAEEVADATGASGN